MTITARRRRSAVRARLRIATARRWCTRQASRCYKRGRGAGGFGFRWSGVVVGIERRRLFWRWGLVGGMGVYWGVVWGIEFVRVFGPCRVNVVIVKLVFVRIE